MGFAKDDEELSTNFWDPDRQQLNFTQLEISGFQVNANPFVFVMKKLKISDKYHFSITGEDGFAKREIGFRTLEQEENHPLMINNMIMDMKKELGYGVNKTTPRTPLLDLSKTPFDMKLDKDKKKPEPEMKHIICPVHQNPMMRRSEDDPRFYCTVYGCTKRARPKEPEQSQEVPQDSTTADSGGSGAEEAAAKVLDKDSWGPYVPNHNPVMIRLVNNRYYLVQNSYGSGELRIDVTEVIKSIDTVAAQIDVGSMFIQGQLRCYVSGARTSNVVLEGLIPE